MTDVRFDQHDFRILIIMDFSYFGFYFIMRFAKHLKVLGSKASQPLSYYYAVDQCPFILIN